MNEHLEFKERVVAEFIRRKESVLTILKKAQLDQLTDAQADDIDYTDLAESPREQLMDEVAQKTVSLEFVAREIELLRSIHTEEVHETVQLGSLLYTNVSCFLIGVAQEQFVFEGKKLMGLSTEAPVYLKMQGFKRKAEFHYGNTEYVILDIF
jgi:hypothetical protein